MKRVVVEVPGMYGDHHVLRVREALLKARGVEAVTATAARRRVAVEFDDAVTSPESIQELLITAGYPPDGELPTRESPQRHEDGSGWYLLPDRTTTTEGKDREMAGDFRRY